MIVASAIRKDGVVYTGRRHCDILCDSTRPFGFLKGGEQGFITDSGEFLDRYKASLHALGCGQIVGPLPSTGRRMCSEDLW